MLIENGVYYFNVTFGQGYFARRRSQILSTPPRGFACWRNIAPARIRRHESLSLLFQVFTKAKVFANLTGSVYLFKVFLLNTKILNENLFDFLTHVTQGNAENREYAFGHKYFSGEKSRDPASRRRAPASDSSI